MQSSCARSCCMWQKSAVASTTKAGTLLQRGLPGGRGAGANATSRVRRPTLQHTARCHEPAPCRVRATPGTAAAPGPCSPAQDCEHGGSCRGCRGCSSHRRRANAPVPPRRQWQQPHRRASTKTASTVSQPTQQQCARLAQPAKSPIRGVHRSAIRVG